MRTAKAPEPHRRNNIHGQEQKQQQSNGIKYQDVQKNVQSIFTIHNINLHKNYTNRASKKSPEI